MNSVSTHIRLGALAAVFAAGMMLPVVAHHGVASADGGMTVGSPDLTAVTTTQVSATQTDPDSSANQLPANFNPIMVEPGS